MIIIAEPVLVNLPKPLIPNGKIAGHIKELASPNKATNQKEITPEVNTERTVNTIPTEVQILSAAC
ncbi:hypothetical protein D3C87_1625280 [compost metagenome]